MIRGCKVFKGRETVGESSVPIASHPQCMPWSSLRSLLTGKCFSLQASLVALTHMCLFSSAELQWCHMLVVWLSFFVVATQAAVIYGCCRQDSVGCVPGWQTKDAQKTAGDYASQVSHRAPPVVLHLWLPSRDL